MQNPVVAGVGRDVDGQAVRLATPRLSLRPTIPSDADRAFEVQSDWNVTRMLRMARFPPDLAESRRWFEDHRRQWLDGEAYRFAVESHGGFIGVADIDEVDSGWGDLGYWLAPSAWGAGIATEAAGAVVRFAFEEVGLTGLRSGHAQDNLASGRVLLKLGFRPDDTVEAWSRSRGSAIRQVRYSLHRGDRAPPGDRRRTA